MTDFDKVPLTEIISIISSHGYITDEQVDHLWRRMKADGRIDREEANVLFAINSVVVNKQNSDKWKNFFIQSIASHLLMDPFTPRTIDDHEWQWLKGVIGSVENIDENVRVLLIELKKKALNVPMDFRTFLSDAGL